MSYIERMRYIKNVLQTPYHFFSQTADKEVFLRLEDNTSCKYSFKGYTMMQTVQEAEKYIKQEINAGSLKDIKKE